MKRFLMVLFALASLLFAKVDINKADTKELSTLKGVGNKTATAIVEYREKNGAFKSIDELTKVKGVGKKTLENNRENITVGE